MWNANLLRGCRSLVVLLALLLAPVGAHAQSGFILTAPGTSRASCTAITSPVTNQTWCADGTGAPSTYLWKVWNGTTYVTVGGGGGGGTGGVCGIAGFVTIAGTDTTGTVTFGTAQPDTSYIVTVSTSPDAGMPPGVLAWYRNKTVNGFTVEITAAPGAGNSVDVSWIVSTNNTAACGTGAVTGSGTAGTLPVWVTSTSLGDSIVSQTANTLTVSKGSSALQTIQASAATSGAGAELVLHGGVATSGIGGGVGLIGGLPSANTLEGGFIEMFGAVGTPGGHITARAGNSTSGPGGFVSIAGGNSPGTGGQVSISGGGGGAGTAGSLVLSAGSGTTAGHVIVNVAGGGTVSGAGSMLVNMLGSNTLTTPDTFQVEGGTINSIGFANVFPTLTTDGTFILGHDNDFSGIPIHSWGAAVGWSITATALDSFGFGSFMSIGGPGPNGGFGDHITITAGSGNYAFGADLTIGGTNDSFAFGGGALVSGPGSVFLGSGFGNSGVSGTGDLLLAVSGHVVNVTGDRSMGFVVEPSSGNPIVTVSGTNTALFWLDGGTSTLSGNNSFAINLKGTLGTFSHNNTFVVSASNSNTMLWAEDGVTTFTYNQEPAGVGWGGTTINIAGVTANASLEANDAAGHPALTVYSPNGGGGAGVGTMRIIPYGSRTSSDGKTSVLQFLEADLSGGHGKSVGFRATTSGTPLAASVIWQLPVADAAGFFTSSGAGVMSIGTTLPSVIFTALGTPGNGTMLYCSDCDPTATLLACTHAGAQTGAFAYRVNGAWKCMG